MNSELQKTWLSNIARERTLEEARSGFFQRAIRAVGIGKRKIDQAPLEGMIRSDEIEKQGYVEYARLNGLSIWVYGLDDESHIRFAVFDFNAGGNRVFAPSEPRNVVFDNIPIFASGCEVNEFIIIFFYVRAFIDDNTIDDDEKAVLEAIRCLFSFRQSDVVGALFNLYRTLLVSVFRDGVVEDCEIGVLTRVQEQMGLDEKGAKKQKLQITAIIAEELLESEYLSPKALNKVIEALRRVNMQFADSMHNKLILKVWMDHVLAYGPYSIESGFNTGNAIPYLSFHTDISKQRRVTHVHRTSVGTRVNLGKTPIYLRQSSPRIEFREQMVPVGVAQFIVTDREILIVGAQSYSLHYDKILKVRRFKEGLFIYYDGKYNAYLYKMGAIEAIKVEFMIDFIAGKFDDVSAEPTDEVKLFSEDVESADFVNPYVDGRDTSSLPDAMMVFHAKQDGNEMSWTEDDFAEVCDPVMDMGAFRKVVVASLPEDYLMWCLDDLEILYEDLDRDEMELIMCDQTDADAAWIISDLNKQDLASLCSALGLPPQGTKPVLRQRIEELEQTLMAQTE